MSKQEAENIIQQLYTAKSLRQIVGKDSKYIKSFFDAFLENPELIQIYSIAQQARSELLADEIVDIADTEPDTYRARNMIDARKWYASKMQPQKYGDRIDLNIIQTVDIAAALTDARKRVSLPTCYSDDTPNKQVIDITPENNALHIGSEPVLDTSIDIFS